MAEKHAMGAGVWRRLVRAERVLPLAVFGVLVAAEGTLEAQPPPVGLLTDLAMGVLGLQQHPELVRGLARPPRGFVSGDEGQIRRQPPRAQQDFRPAPPSPAPPGAPPSTPPQPGPPSPAPEPQPEPSPPGPPPR